MKIKRKHSVIKLLLQGICDRIKKIPDFIKKVCQYILLSLPLVLFLGGVFAYFAYIISICKSPQDFIIALGIPLAGALICIELIYVKRYIQMICKFATLPLTINEFDILTQKLTLCECLEYFSSYISFQLDDAVFFYQIPKQHSTDFHKLLELIYEKYKSDIIESEHISYPILRISVNPDVRQTQELIQNLFQKTDADNE